MEVQLHAFLASALHRGELPTSLPSRFTPRERDPSTHWIGDWVGLSACPDAVAKVKNPCPCLGSNTPCPARSWIRDSPHWHGVVVSTVTALHVGVHKP